MDLESWLKSLGLERYESIFRENAIDAELLHELTDNHLREMNLPLGVRIRLLKAISALGPGPGSIGLAIPVAPSGPPADTAERRQVTVMFSDLVGSTVLAARMDPENLREIISAYQKRVAETVQRYDGFVARYMGDGVLAYFGYPRAHEDNAERAVRAGLDVVTAVAGLNSPTPLQSRIGIATGIVVVGELIGSGDTRERAMVGETPNLAARLQGIAKPDMVVICDTTRRLLGGRFELEDLGSKELKGLDDPMQAWAALRVSAAEGRFEAMHASGLTALVGREEEAELLLRRWSKAKSGEGQVVLLSGEAGIGKSRLTAALLQSLTFEPHVRIRYFCSPHHEHSPLHPFTAQLERAAGLEPGDSASAKLDKLDTLLKPTASNAPRDVALMADLLSVPLDGRYPALRISPQQKREMTLTALLDQLAGIAARSFVLLVFEDIHWIDPTSLDLLDRTIARAAHLPVLLVITLRPEFQPAWVGQPHVTMLQLNRLGRRDSAHLMGGVTKGKALPDAVVEQVLAHTDGVPLFIEELTSTLLESGLLREATDRYVLNGPLLPLAIPTTLQASLVARLDRLSSVKDVAQIGAAIGREFSHELIAAVASLKPRELDAALERLTASGLISCRGTPPTATYTFKHALVQDAAYATLLKSRRRQLHAVIAKVVVERFPALAETLPEDVARHFTEGGLPSEAIDYWLRAGQRADMRSAYAEAVEHLTKGIELTELLPAPPERDRKELSLLLALGPTLTAAKGYSAEETLRAYSRARDLLSENSTLAEQMIARSGHWNVHWGRAEHIAGLELAKQCLALALRHDNADALILTKRMMGLTLYPMGALQEARRYLEEMLGLSAASQDVGSDFDLAYGVDNPVVAQSNLARILWLLGYPEQAAAAGTEAVTRARTLGRATTTAVALHGEVTLGAFGGDQQRAATYADEMEVLGKEHSLANWENWARFHQGLFLARRGDPQLGIEVMLAANETAEAMNAKILWPQRLGYIAAAHASLGQVDVGLDFLAEAVQTVEKTDERFFEAELYRLRGEMCLTLGKTVEAEAALQRALEVARHQQARFWELRAATHLAAVWFDHGRSAEARDLLAPVYGWFTEGFDLPDLKQARSMLDKLVRAVK